MEEKAISVDGSGRTDSRPIEPSSLFILRVGPGCFHKIFSYPPPSYCMRSSLPHKASSVSVVDRFPCIGFCRRGETKDAKESMIFGA